jgi:TsgA-like MFS transporter
MTRAKLPATIVAIATYVIVAGIFTQSGVVLEPAAAFFHASLPDTAVLFSYASAGNLSGIIVSLVAFNLFSIRTVLVAAYACLFAGVGTIVATHDLAIACGAILAIGLGVGTGLSAGAVILAKLYADRARAVAFLCTDCAFSASGFVLPAIAGALIAEHARWWSGYVVVAVLALLVLVAAVWLTFPATGRAERAARQAGTAAPAPRGSTLRIALISLGLALYLTGQTTFTIWAPAVLERS